MPKLGKSPFDDPAFVVADVIPSNAGINLGSADKPYKRVYAEEGITQETVTAERFNLEDGSPLNYSVAATAAGTVYTLTASYAAVDFGTTDPAIVLNKAGTYLLNSSVAVKFNAATFAANQTLSLKLRRTNNTAADVAGSERVVTLPIITTITDGFSVQLPSVVYTTTGPTVITDAIALFAALSALPGAGTVSIEQANIVAVRIA